MNQLIFLILRIFLKTLKLGTQVSTTLPYMEIHRDKIPYSIGEIASDYRAHPIIGKLLYVIYC